MKKNTSTRDRIARLLIAAVFIFLDLCNAIGFPENMLVWFVAIVLVVTSIVGVCPVYTLFGINTHTGKKVARKHH